MTSQSLDSKLSDKDLLTGNLPYIAQSAIAPLILDYAGLFGSAGAIDSPLTAIATLGSMAGIFGRHRDAGMLAGLTYGAQKVVELAFDYMKDGRFNDSNPAIEKNLATYGLALLAGLGARYVYDNWENKTKPVIYATGRGIKTATSATGRGINSKLKHIPVFGRLYKRVTGQSNGSVPLNRLDTGDSRIVTSLGTETQQ